MRERQSWKNNDYETLYTLKERAKKDKDSPQILLLFCITSIGFLIQYRNSKV
ncbi:hypothetical protein I79_025108 [Cricetulus griseus]|uniref:Uncharacterized protein n=1 Tax=Cricetulus griseus TaxID=10029 RepID=G3IMG9_CRIGR|nr:hypothetical protein I79_025108 [Cricetulus griseus]